MGAQYPECVQCGKRTKRPVLIQICVPEDPGEGEPHELLDNLMICRTCLKDPKQCGTLGLWMNDILRQHGVKEG